MKNINIKEVKGYAQTQQLCSLPIAPLGFMQYCSYPSQLSCAVHVFGTSYVSLILEGEMVYHELGREALRCRRGDLIIIPRLCHYSWETIEPTFAFQCGHSEFSLCEHGRLSLLFGINQKQLERVHLGEEITAHFNDRIKAAREHQLKELYVSVATLELFTNAAELFYARFSNKIPNSSSELIKQYVYYIEKHIQRDITISELAKYRNISRRSLFTLFKKTMKMAPLEYVASRKIEFAKRLINTTTMSCDEIAQQLGFSSSNYFVRFFKKNTGITPMQFRRQLREI